MGLEFGGLPLAGRRPQQAGHGDAAPGRKPLDFGFVVGQRRLGDDLEVAEAGAVVEFQEAEAGLRVAAGADPAGERHLLAEMVGASGLGNGESFHRGKVGSGQFGRAARGLAHPIGSARQSYWIFRVVPTVPTRDRLVG